jgi:uncharacterized protein (DUF1800 family)
MGNVNWMFHLVNTKRPLEEKMALFWHHVFATGNSKVDNYDQLLTQIKLFRDKGMGNYRDLLLDVAKNPTMIFWLDNQQNHGNAVNENWGRELLELFSLKGLHRLDFCNQDPARTLWPVSLAVRVSPRRSR